MVLSMSCLRLGASISVFAFALATPSLVVADAVPLAGTTDSMHARYYSPNLGRFMSVDPIGGKIGSSQSWNRYAYAENNPVNGRDPDGLDVIYENKKDKKFFEKAAARNSMVRRTLDRFAPGSGRDLLIRRVKDAGQRRTGTQNAATATIAHREGDPGDPAVQAAMVAAYQGEKTDEAGLAAMEKTQRDMGEVTGATINIGPQAGEFEKLHELGHVDHATTDLGDYLDAAAEAEAMSDSNYEISHSENVADNYATAAMEKDKVQKQ
jgi:RHS repeat-associated protein